MANRPLRITIALLLMMNIPMAAAQDEHHDWSKVNLRISKVAGTVYMIDSVDDNAGGNIGASIGPDGIVIVDDQFAQLIPKIQAALKTVSDKPIRFVINTHVHGDHIGGNEVLGTTSTIVAHANTRSQLAVATRPEFKGPRLPVSALPIITIDDSLSLHQNGEDIRVLHLPGGHSNTDVVVFFKQSNVVHMGDIYFSGMFPIIDLRRGGDVRAVIAGVERVLSEIPPDAKIIPGHGHLSNVAELRNYLNMLKETTAIVEAGINKKWTLERMINEKVLAKYAEWADGYISADDYLKQLYSILTRASDANRPAK